EARRSEERDQGLRTVRRERDDAVALADAQGLQRAASGGDLPAKPAVRDLLGQAVFAVEDHGQLVVGLRRARDAGAERVFGVVERAAVEPLRGGHRARKDLSRRLVPADAEEVRDARPEL